MELELFLDGTHAGTFWQDATGGAGFTYDSDWIASNRAYPVSMSMPLTRTEHKAKPVRAFLWGLLPDSEGALRRIAAENHVSERNALGLLSAVGKDAAGAVQLLPPNVEPTDAGSRLGTVERLDQTQFEALMVSLATHSDDWDPGRIGGRWSLAGAQSKVALYREEDGTWSVPLDSTPTTHILKPGIDGFSHHEINEHLTQRAAGLLGLDAAHTELVDGGAAGHILVSTRFDRERVDGRLHRLHQEDMCQALSVLPNQKYQKEGGPGLAQIADLLISTVPRDTRSRSQEAMFDAVVFTVAIAGTDAHAKNFALMLDHRGQRLAPLYDMASALPYEERLTRSGPLLAAMRVDGEERFNSIGRKQLLAVARKLQLPAFRAEERIEAILGGTADAYDAAVAEFTNSELRRAGGEIASAVRGWGERRGWIES